MNGFRRFELIPSIISICGVGLMLSLGFWQLQRLEWKEALIVRVEAAQTSAPKTTLPKDAAALEALEFYRVKLKGTFQHNKELQLQGKYHGTQLGVHLVTPFVIADGRSILVDRGWVPNDKKDPKLRPETLPKSPVEIEAMVRLGDHPQRFLPANDPTKNMWLWRDPKAMAAATGTKAAPIILEEIKGNTDAYPIGSEGKIELRNDHLGYAITWFAVAIAGILIYLLYHRR